MKKKQVNAILVEQTKRRKKIIDYISIIAICLIISFTFIYIFINKNRTYYVSYKENSNIDYHVFLKNNDFFESNYLTENKQYVASLIDKINANFNYYLSVDEKNIDYKYQYYIEAEVNVNDKTTSKSLYSYKEKLVNDVLKYSNNDSEVRIDENVDIDYNKYNSLVKRFVDFYDLNDAVTMLNVSMHVKVLGDCESIKDSYNNSVFSISMPLTTKTVDIDVEKKMVDNDQERFMACIDNTPFIYIYLLIGILVGFVSCFIIFKLVKYVVKTRTAESIYQRELNKILNNYKSYIQKVNNSFDISKYQILRMDTFTDMLEIRDTVQQPILMSQNKNNTGVYFIIPSNTKILYVYSIKVSDIKKRMIRNADMGD